MNSSGVSYGQNSVDPAHMWIGLNIVRRGLQMVTTQFIHRTMLPMLAVTVTTQSPEILFIHGATATAETWIPLMYELQRLGMGSVAVDLRGHGKSHGHETLQVAGIRDYVADARDVIEQFQTAHVVVGHSMGGLVAQLLASEIKLQRAVLIASSPVGGMKVDGYRMARKHPWTFLAASVRRSFKRLYINETVARSLLFHPQTPDAVVRLFMSHVQEESWRAGSEMNSLLPDPSAVMCPISVIGGSDDFMVSRTSTEATAAAYHTQAVYIDHCAHMVPYEVEPHRLALAILSAIHVA